MSAHSLRDYYSARAAEYDHVYAKPERQHDLRRIEFWLPTVFEGRSVIEVACGTGYWTQFLAPVATRLLAIDAAPETLRIARTRIRAAHVEFVEGDAYRLPDVGTRYEAAFAGFWISHVPRGRIGAFLNGLHTRLSPGAKVVFLDNKFVAGSSTPISDRDSEGNTYQARTLRDGSCFRVLKNFPTETEMRSWLAEGTRDVRCQEWEHYWALEYTLP
jgi:ubiquinone/menaquinone biosynthesis C-methylase UbiE